MPHLFDVVDREDYQSAVDGRYIKVQTHPTLPYLIHNYTDAATWDQAWTPATVACRGLITHAESGEVLARPLKKFFNVGQAHAPEVALEEKVVVTDKLDGSLGILFPTPDGGHQIATRGSFASEQALWATAHYLERYAGVFTPNPAWTYLFEIVYADNRIVLVYPFEGLVLLGAVDVATGVSVPLEEAAAAWPGPVAETFQFASFGEALAAPARENAEGFVVWVPDRDVRVKIKQEDYLRLHRILSNTNARHIWEILAAGQDLAVEFADAPDEWHAWVAGIAADLRIAHEALIGDARKAHQEILAGLPEGFERRDYAMIAGQHPLRPYLFLLLDGSEGKLSDAAWKAVRPEAERAFTVISSDAD